MPVDPNSEVSRSELAHRGPVRTDREPKGFRPLWGIGSREVSTGDKRQLVEASLSQGTHIYRLGISSPAPANVTKRIFCACVALCFAQALQAEPCSRAKSVGDANTARRDMSNPFAPKKRYPLGKRLDEGGQSCCVDS